MAEGLKPKDVAAAIKANINKSDELQKLLAITRAVVPQWQKLAKAGKGSVPADVQNVLKLIESRLGQLMAQQRQKTQQAGRTPSGGTVLTSGDIGRYLPKVGTYLPYLSKKAAVAAPTAAAAAKPASGAQSAQAKSAATAAKARAAKATAGARAKVAAHVAQVKRHQIQLVSQAKKIQQSLKTNPSAEHATKAKDALNKLRAHVAADTKNIIEIQKLLKNKKK